MAHELQIGRPVIPKRKLSPVHAFSVWLSPLFFMRCRDMVRMATLSRRKCRLVLGRDTKTDIQHLRSASPRPFPARGGPQEGISSQRPPPLRVYRLSLRVQIGRFSPVLREMRPRSPRWFPNFSSQIKASDLPGDLGHFFFTHVQKLRK